MKVVGDPDDGIAAVHGLITLLTIPPCRPFVLTVPPFASYLVFIPSLGSDHHERREPKS